jgi:hypothetical protein
MVWQGEKRGSTCHRSPSAEPKTEAVKTCALLIPTLGKSLDPLMAWTQAPASPHSIRRLFLVWKLLQPSSRPSGFSFNACIHHRHAPDLMLLHRPFAFLQVLAITASHRVQADEFLNRSTLWVETFGDHRTTQISICDHSDELARLLIFHDWNATNVMVA